MRRRSSNLVMRFVFQSRRWICHVPRAKEMIGIKAASLDNQTISLASCIILCWPSIIPKIINPGPCLRPTRTTCDGLSTTESHLASSPGCWLLLEKRIWYWRRLAQIFEFGCENAIRGVLSVRVGGCHDVVAVRCRTEKIDRMSIVIRVFGCVKCILSTCRREECMYVARCRMWPPMLSAGS